MRNLLRALVLAACMLPGVAAAQCNISAPLPTNSVVGRLGIGPGPCQAIPFTALLSSVGSVPLTRNINTTSPLTGGGNLGSDRTIALPGGAGMVLAGAGPAFTNAPALGVAGSAVGSIIFNNLTSGSVTLQPATGALGAAVASLPAGTYTVVGDSLAQSLTNKSLTSSTDVLGGVTMTLGSDATGDIYYRNSSGILTRLPIGSAANVLAVSGGIPAWVPATGGGNVSNTGTPTANQIAQWTNATTVQGVNLASLLTAGNFVSITGTTSPTIAVSAATKTDQQTGTSNVLAVTPLHQQDHDSAVKAWCTFVGVTTGTHSCTAAYNVTSVTRASAGTYTVTFTTPFASATSYGCTGTSYNAGNNTYVEMSTAATLAGSQGMFALTTANTATDPDDVMVTCFGRQ